MKFEEKKDLIDRILKYKKKIERLLDKEEEKSKHQKNPDGRYKSYLGGTVHGLQCAIEDIQFHTLIDGDRWYYNPYDEEIEKN